MTRDELVRAAMTTDDRLHDIARARIWNGLEDRLAAPVPRRVRWPYAIAAAAIAATVAAVLLARGAAPEPTIVVAGDATLTQPIGPHTRAALVGPAELEVVGTPADTTVVRLRTGVFLAEFAGGPGRALRIEAPHAIVDVVGTVFAVEARPTATCVSVRHGKVRVTTATATTFVGAGERYCSDTGTLPITPEIDEALHRHTQILTASADDKPPTPPTGDEALHATADETPTTPTPAASTAEPIASVHADNRPISAPDRTTNGDRYSSGANNMSGSRTKKGSDPISANGRTTDGDRPRIQEMQNTGEVLSGSRTKKGSDPISANGRTTDADPARLADAPDMASQTPSASRSRTTAADRGVADVPETHASPTARPAPLSADELYHAAETALAGRDGAAADRALERLIANHPTSPLIEQALYERARIAHGSRAWATARKHLDRLLALPSPRLAEPARYLACRIAVEARDGEAATCLVEYRKAYPRSPHDREVLGLLVQLAHASGGCTAAASWLAQLAREHPNAPLTAAWRRRCPEAR